MNLPPPSGSPIIARIQNNSQLPIIVGIAAGVLLVILAFMEVARRLKKAYAQQAEGEGQKTRPTTRLDIRYMAKDYGFSKDEAALLFEICGRYKVPNARFFFKDYEQTSNLFKTAYLDFQSEMASEQMVSLVFSIYEKINRFNLTFTNIPATTALRAGQKLLYIDPDGKKYAVSVIDTNKHELFLTMPINRTGKSIIMQELSKIPLMIQGKNEIAFSTSVRVLRTQVKEGVTMVVVTHSHQLEPFLKHEYVYIQARVPCQMRNAESTPGDSKDSVHYAAEGRTYDGILLNYSGTSCNIIAKHSINIHQILSVKVKLNGQDVDEIIVMVMNAAEHEENHTFLLHANFVKLTEKTKNYILSHVYSFTA